MCGIAGYWSADAAPDERVVMRMTAALEHRGPDGHGIWLDAESGVALGHRRLAIIDITDAGHQPMTSASGRYVVTYNGEIYNHDDLRAELLAAAGPISWRGHSDTEVMANAFDAWGVSGTLARLNGMFAFAVWDKQRRVLTLARDRLGEKPLYYGRMGKTFLFGSELKALTAHPDFRKEINREAVTAYLQYHYVPAPLTIWHGVNKLEPGHYIEIGGASSDLGPSQPYWDFWRAVHRGLGDPLSDPTEYVPELEGLLCDAVKRRMVSDVPLGAFLSGGVDSSLIVSLMQAQSSAPVRTFTIGFNVSQANEAVHAKAIAAHLGTEHTELYLEAEDGLKLVPKLPRIWDEPFADVSQLPTYFLSEMTRQHVTVALSGDGGDELFGGYNRYSVAARLWEQRDRVPAFARRPLAKLLRSPAVLKAAASMMDRVPAKYRYLGIGDRLPKVAHVLEAVSEDDLYGRLTSHIAPAEQWVRGVRAHQAAAMAPVNSLNFRQRMMAWDTLSYLPDDILTKVDRASMAVSLETRVPFLDHRVVEYAWRLPMSAKFHDGRGKHILREVLDRYVPRRLIDRPKMGFGVPIDTWLATSLRSWAEDLLNADTLRDQGLLEVGKVRQLWSAEKERGGHHYRIWSILMLQAWLEEHGRGGVSTPVAEDRLCA